MTLVYLALAWCAGIWLAHQLWGLGLIGCETAGVAFAAPALVALAAAGVCRGRPALRRFAILLAAAVLGAWRYQAQPFAVCPAPDRLATYNGTIGAPAHVAVEGVIVGYPDVRDTRTFYRIRADRLTIAGQSRPVQGDLLAQAPRFPAFAYGDRVRAAGQLVAPPTFDDFDYAAYLSARGIHSLLRRAHIELIAHDQGHPFWAALYRVRAAGSALLNRVLPEPAAALANGMLLGIESGIPPAVDEAFKATGTAHVIVISGSNIALLTGVLMGLLGRSVGKARAPLPVVVAIVLYVLLVGADPPALRAGIMGILYVIAAALGRTSTAYVSLCFSALIMTLINPLSLWDVGFQLSFAATLGLILFTPALQARAEALLARRLPQPRVRQAMGFLNDALIVTLAAQLLTLPLLVYYFGRLSVVSLLANFLILPAQPAIMFGGMITLVGGLIWEAFGRVAAAVPWLFLTYTVAVVRTLAAAPLASVETGALGRALAVCYGIALAVWFLRRSWPALYRQLPLPAHAGRWSAAVLASTWLVVSVANLLPDGRLHVLFIPEQGSEAVLVTTPGGRRAWIWDGQGDGERLAAATRPWLTAGDGTVSLALGPNTAGYWPEARALDADQLAAGTLVRLGDGVELICAAAGAWLLRYGDFSVLLPPTISPAVQAQLDVGRLALLKTAGPDTRSWPQVAFLERVSPQIILWPEGTTYPPDATAWLVERRATRVAEDGMIEVISDGRRVWLRQWNGTRR